VCQDHGVVDVVEAPETAAGPERRRRSRRFWVAIGAVAVLLIGVTITALEVSFHYAHAPRLEAFGWGWLPPDNQHAQYPQAGLYDASVARARPGHWQTFSVDVENPSSVTQTVLGLAFDSSDTAQPERLTISSVDTGLGDAMLARYTPGPVAIPPNGVRTLRLSVRAAGCNHWGHGTGRSDYWTALFLKVRVGWFTRTEEITFVNHAQVLRGTLPPC
jgi:hypothetical protein